MKFLNIFFTVCFFLCLYCGVSAKEPVINEIIPPRAFPGDKIILKGTDFSPSTIVFGKIKTQPLKTSENEIEVIVPDGSKVCNIYIESGDVKSNEIKFYVLPYVELKLESSKIEIDKKIKGIITVYGSKKTWTVQVINKYYEIVDLEGGKEITVITSGGDKNTAEITITAKNKGNFNINFKVLSGDPDALKDHKAELKSQKKQQKEDIEPEKNEEKKAEPQQTIDKVIEKQSLETTESVKETEPIKETKSENNGSIPKEIFHKSNNDF